MSILFHVLVTTWRIFKYKYVSRLGANPSSNKNLRNSYTCTCKAVFSPKGGTMVLHHPSILTENSLQQWLTKCRMYHWCTSPLLKIYSWEKLNVFEFTQHPSQLCVIKYTYTHVNVHIRAVSSFAWTTCIQNKAGMDPVFYYPDIRSQ